MSEPEDLPGSYASESNGNAATASAQPASEGATPGVDWEQRRKVRWTEHGSGVGDLAARTLAWRPGMIGDPAVWDRFWWLRRHARRGQKTMDAGCGSGWFALYLASLDNDVVGVSFNEKANEAATRRAQKLGEQRVRFVQGDLRELDRFGPELGRFEQIICFETIEHILNDQKLVDDLADRLEPGGRLLLTTPSDNHPQLPGEVISPEEDGGHVRLGYSHERLREICAQAGLEVVRADRFTGWIGQMQFRLITWLSYKIGFLGAAVLSIPLRVFQVFDPLVTRLLSYPELEVAVIAEKPRA